MSNGTAQGLYWSVTIPEACGWVPNPDLFAYNTQMTYIRGQLEEGENGYLHYQLMIYCKKKIRMGSLKSLLCNEAHLELSRSDKLRQYVWKEETRVGEPFEYGLDPFLKSQKRDWAAIRKSAIEGKFDEIEDDIFIRCYGNLTRIAKDNATPQFRHEIVVRTYWGVTGSGKSHFAFEEAMASGDYYRKSSTTKWWDGYKGEPNVIIDEFDGHSIALVHLLQWMDKYPMSVENKGGALPISATNFWITTNIDPRQWYPDAPEVSKAALLRRLTEKNSYIKHFAVPYVPRVIRLINNELIEMDLLDFLINE